MSESRITGLLLEGVTGSGKTQTLKALRAHPAFSALMDRGRVFLEEATFGEFMDELRQSESRPGSRYRRLDHVLRELEQEASAGSSAYGYVLERFHLSYYALSWTRRTICAIATRSSGNSPASCASNSSCC